GKELKEVEIVELPSSSRFMDYKIKKIENKIITVNKTGIYKFRFANSGIAARICKYKIQRIPASNGPKTFDCNVYWRNGYDTTYTTDMEEFMSNADTVINNFQERSTKVLASSATPGNKACFNFILPDNTVAWSYYLSVDANGQKSYEESSKKFTASQDYLVAKYARQTPLLALALGHDAYLERTSTGSSIDYWIVEGDNANLFLNAAQFRYMKKAKGNTDFAKMDVRKGSLNFCFSNNNPSEVLNVTVKITAVQVNQFIDTKPVQRIHVTPKKEMYLKN
ncbi:MAG TPA: hypothetical protein VF476_07250, partial [Chitinophagaceae bacterium]